MIQATQLSTIDNKAAFELLYEQLVYFHDGFFDGGYKVVGSLLLILGWLVTSDKARAALRHSPLLRMAGSVAILLCSVGYTFLTLGLEAKSQATAALLGRLDYFPRELYDAQVITMKSVFLVGGIVVVIGLVILTMLVRLPADAPPSDGH